MDDVAANAYHNGTVDTRELAFNVVNDEGGTLTVAEEGKKGLARKTTSKKAEDKKYKVSPVCGSDMEKCEKANESKIADKARRDAEKRAENLEKAKLIKIMEDPLKPVACSAKISQLGSYRGQRVKIFGWVYHLRRQGKNLLFVTLRDGSGLLQCVLTGQLCHTYEALILSTESSVQFYGTVELVPDGKKAPGGHELAVDYWCLIGSAPAGGAEVYLNEEAHFDVQLDHRYLLIRRERVSKVLELRSLITESFNEHYKFNGYKRVYPPTLVQTQVEGGSTLFEFNYFGEKAYLTQSSQFYLETVLPSLFNVYCIERSYRAEQSRTRRHLAEFTHVEAECAFISFDDLLIILEDLIVDVCERVMASHGELVYELNPDFIVPKKPLKRMDYKDAILFLKENGIGKEDGTFYEIGEDIPEMAERKMTDLINEPIMLCRFPAAIKAFYMKRCPEDNLLTESVDVLLPGVGEVIGGSMRIDDYDELIRAFKHENIDPASYYWYTNQRKFGTCPHGGYGLGLERFICWMLKLSHVRDTCLYPRYMGRCVP